MVITSADDQFSAKNQVMGKKRSAGRSLPSPELNLPKIFVFLQQMPKRRIFGDFFMSSEDKIFFVKKEDMSSKKRTYGNPRRGTCTMPCP